MGNDDGEYRYNPIFETFDEYMEGKRKRRMRLLRKYKNGNYSVLLFNDGTKVRVLDDGETEYKPEYPESIDLCVSHQCSMGCKYCYADCTKDSKSFDLLNNTVKYFINNVPSWNRNCSWWRSPFRT